MAESEVEQREPGRFVAWLRRLDRNPALLAAARRARERLPGDSEFGDTLSTAGRQQPHVIGRRLTALTADRPGLLREAGLSALQVWQSLSEVQGRGRGTSEVAIAFTDLVDFSDWALEAGDERALRLLRDVDHVLEPAVCERDGEVVKRLGDGMMAVFDEPQAALEGLLAIFDGLDGIEADGYRPRLRAGLHVGRPRALGGDWFGVDVTIAARLGEHADADEILVSEPTLDRLDVEGLKVKRRRRFKVKGAPNDLGACAISRTPAPRDRETAPADQR